MILSSFFKTFLPVATVSLVLACSGGSDGDGGDGDGDATGGSDPGDGDGDTGGTASGGGTATGGETGGDGDGDGPIDYGSGTVDMTFNGTAVNFEVWNARQDISDQEFYFVGDSTNSDTVDIVQLEVRPGGVGTFDCTDSYYGTITVQAEDTEGETSSFESGGVSACTINITEYGEVGEPIQGTFSAELEAVGGMIGSVDGSFELVRGSDS